MLPTLGKVLDCTGNGIIDGRQYAYRQGRGTADALRSYVQQLEEAKVTGRHIVTVALDL